jgi:hypothetical protein
MDRTDFQVHHPSQRPAFLLIPGVVSVCYPLCGPLALACEDPVQNESVHPVRPEQVVPQQVSLARPGFVLGLGLSHQATEPVGFPVNRRAGS